jgi:hypothetical protein
MEFQISPGLHALMTASHLALIWMVVLYAIKIVILLKKPGPPEKAELKGDRFAGGTLSLLNVLMPWQMESSRNNLYFYTEFIVFHVAVALTITSTFTIPFTPWLMTPTVCVVIMVFQALATAIGIRRIIRRVAVPEVRVISTVDDYFALVLLTSFFAVGVGAFYYLSQGRAETPWMWVFFALVTFFIIYVPFSKISHYVLYPFSRWMYGQIFGGRGIINQSNPNATWVPKTK